MSKILKNIGKVCRMIKIEHSVFALPFAYAGAFFAAGGWPGWRIMIFLTVAMVAVRSFAMAYNRLADVEIDAKNPRTQDRPLVSGELTPRFTMQFIVACATIFVLACAGLNWVCFALSPLALIWSAFYSYCKRFTHWCHFVLGSVLGLAPVAGGLAVTAEVSLTSALLFFGVLFWVAGFDLLYACQDREFDREEGLNSIPAKLGLRAALGISSVSHFATAAFFVLAGWAAGAGFVYFLAALGAGLFLMWEHRLISAEDMSRVNVAFFTINGIISVLLFAGVIIDLALR